MNKGKKQGIEYGRNNGIICLFYSSVDKSPAYKLLCSRLDEYRYEKEDQRKYLKRDANGNVTEK